MSVGPVANPSTPAAQSLEPSAAKNGSPAVKQAYSEALSFESVLVNQLCEQLMSTTGLGGSGGAGASSAGLGAFAGLLPGALASSIMSDGGLGLAAQLAPSLQPQAPSGGGTAGG